MRDIKYRVWNPEFKEMYILSKKEYLGGTGIYDDSVGHDKSVWMQFTGLHDRNGREIYEGDIIEEYDDGLYHWVVKWDNEYACFYLHEQNIGEKFYLDDLVSVVNKGKVIGNIFQDGDLLDSEISKVDRD